MGRPRIPPSKIADSFVLQLDLGPDARFPLHKGKKIFRGIQSWQAERVVLMNDEIEWRLFWRDTHVVQRLGDMTPDELRAWLIEEIDELYAE